MNSQLLRIANRAIAVPCLILALASCTVKEDRRVCPCTLEVSFYDKENTDSPVTLVGWSETELFDVKIRTEDYPDSYSRSAPRSMIHFGAAAGVATSVKVGHHLVVPEGFECDSLYTDCDYIDCTGETARTTVRFHKQFSSVHINVANESYDPREYILEVKCGSCGIDMLSCRPVAGSFSCVPDLYGEKEYRCRIPRQADDGMTLTVTHLSGDEVVFPLGAFVSSVGYDWDATDLQDIYVTLDIARGRVGVGVAGWESVEDFELSTVEF